MCPTRSTSTRASSGTRRRRESLSEGGMNRIRRLTAALALALLAAAAGAADQSSQHPLKAGVFDPPRIAPDFTLQGSDGTPLKLSRYRGKVVALGFGYTFCPDVCPTTLVDLAAARKKLG